MPRGEEERADLERVEALRPAERAHDDFVEQGPRPQEESAVDRAAGHLLEGSPSGVNRIFRAISAAGHLTNLPGKARRVKLQKPFGLRRAITFSAAARPRKRSCGVNRANLAQSGGKS
jgi:hypothetical protein